MYPHGQLRLHAHPCQHHSAAIFEQYNLAPLLHKGGVYVKFCRSMYGLPQAGRLANDALVPLLSKHGYHQCKHTLGLVKYETRWWL
jgi:hypothetical protein